MKMIFFTLLGLISPAVLGAPPKLVQIGALFHGPDSQQEIVFKQAIDMINTNRSSLRFVEIFERVREHDSLQVSNSVCNMLSQGVWAIFGPQSSRTVNHVQSICDTMEVPHIEARWNIMHKRQDILVNLYPYPRALAKVFVDLIQAFEWKSFTIIYEDIDGLAKLSPLFKMFVKKGQTVTVRKLDSDPNFRPLLRSLHKLGETNFLLDCSFDKLGEVLKQMQQVGLLVSTNSFIIMNLDMHLINLEPFQHGGSNITGVRLVDPNDTYVKQTLQKWTRVNKRGRPVNIKPDELHVESALIYDAVDLFARTVHRMSSKANATSMSCEDNSSWFHGFTLTNMMKDGHNSFRGLTGAVMFDNEGFRSNFLLDVVELTLTGLKKVGTWNSSEGLNLMRTQSVIPYHADENLITNKTLIVLISLTEPYGMRKKNSVQLSGNNRYEGFGVDVIQEVASILNFSYTFELQKDNRYGSLNNVTGEWDGMIREIQDGRADLAITDLTITAERQTGADFTLPFMNVGISILYKKPTRAAPYLFSFKEPFSNGVWIVMFFAYIGVSLLLFIMGRICPYEWTNPYPCIEEPEELENQFSFKNSLWFTIGSLMQQGSEIAPIAVSTRMVAGIWWFFTLIMVSSYTANLAAFLTVEIISQPFKTAEELVHQTAIKYGAKSGGSTLNFFRDSDNPTFKRMYKTMISTPGVLVEKNEDGLEKVKTEEYAYFMESTSIEYIVERNCEVQQYGGLLDNKGYGIAMRKNYPYRNALNGAVLQLQESGLLMQLKDKWWKEERGGGQCQNSDTAQASSGLKLENVGGVFVVLVSGIGLAVFMTMCELLWDVLHTSLKEKVPFNEVLVEELKFIVKLHGSTKPVRKYLQDVVDEDIAMIPYPYGYVNTSREPLTK